VSGATLAWQWSARGDGMVFHSELEDSAYLVPLVAGEMFPRSLVTAYTLSGTWPRCRERGRSRRAPCRDHHRTSTPSIGTPSSGISIALQSGSGLQRRAASLSSTSSTWSGD
jgi:hypothetical protein